MHLRQSKSQIPTWYSISWVVLWTNHWVVSPSTSAPDWGRSNTACVHYSSQIHKTIEAGNWRRRRSGTSLSGSVGRFDRTRSLRHQSLSSMPCESWDRSDDASNK